VRNETENNTNTDSVQEPEKKKGLLKRIGSLTKRLAKTKKGFVGKIKQAITLRGKLDEELLEEVESILIQADIGVETTLKIIERIRNEHRRKELNNPETILQVFKQTIYEMLKEREGKILWQPTSKPYVILTVGVNGVGKTTTIAKLAQKYKSLGKKVMLVAGDTFRAAAIEQLEIWAKRTGSDIIKQSMGADAASVCFDAISAARKRNTDVVIVDTAGRLHTKVNLMEELKKIVRVIKKQLPSAPDETLLVLDATTGQNAISQTRIFKADVDVTAIALTKLDGTAKGGVIIAIADLFDIPIKLIGVGEQADDLRDFNAQEFVDALFTEL